MFNQDTRTTEFYIVGMHGNSEDMELDQDLWDLGINMDLREIRICNAKVNVSPNTITQSHRIVPIRYIRTLIAPLQLRLVPVII